MAVRIWHNPRCSKSRETLALLVERGLDPQVILYLDEPPSGAEILKAAKALRRPVREMIRAKEPAYNQLGLNNPDLSDADLAEALSQNPALIERPVVFRGDRAALGRPPEAALELFDQD